MFEEKLCKYFLFVSFFLGTLKLRSKFKQVLPVILTTSTNNKERSRIKAFSAKNLHDLVLQLKLAKFLLSAEDWSPLPFLGTSEAFDFFHKIFFGMVLARILESF